MLAAGEGENTPVSGWTPWHSCGRQHGRRRSILLPARLCEPRLPWDADATATPFQGIARDVSVDLGGTWVSCGIGAQFTASSRLSFYGMLERSNGSDYQDDYRCSVGARCIF